MGDRQALVTKAVSALPDELSIIDIRKSRTAVLARVECSDGFGILKIGDGWTSEKAHAVANAHRAWRRAIDPDIVDVVRVRAVIEVPPAVCLSYAPGAPLDDVLTGRTGPKRTAARWIVDKGCFYRCGAALGAYHSAHPADDKESVEGTVAALLRRLRLPAGTGGVIPVMSAGDYAPYNVHVDRHARLHLFDLAPASRPTSAHRDVAWFLHWCDRWTRGRPRVRRRIKQDFIEGYASAHHPLNTSADRTLIAAFTVTFQAQKARKRFKRGQVWGAGIFALRAGRSWLRAARFRLPASSAAAVQRWS